jgi:hypothetical protein
MPSPFIRKKVQHIDRKLSQRDRRQADYKLLVILIGIAVAVMFFALGVIAMIQIVGTSTVPVVVAGTLRLHRFRVNASMRFGF